MNTADLITAFFNNEMSPDQERQFLLSVASSDSMRLGLKSHVMLDKLLQEQADLTTVPPMVRTTILREAAVVAAAAASGLAVSEAEAAIVDEPTTGPTVTAPRPSLLSRIPRWTAYPMSLLLAVGGYFVGLAAAEENEGPASVIESTPLLEPTDENAALPADDLLGEENASVIDEITTGDADPVISTTNEGERTPHARQLERGRTASSPRQSDPVNPAEPVANANGSTSSPTDSGMTRDPSRVLFPDMNVRTSNDSTKK